MSKKYFAALNYIECFKLKCIYLCIDKSMPKGCKIIILDNR